MTFTPDPAGLNELLRGFEPYMKDIAGAVVNEARQAPRVGVGQHEVDAITVGDFHVDEHGAVQDIRWDSSFWHLVEYGSSKNPPYRPLTRAAQNQGLVVKDRGPH